MKEKVKKVEREIIYFSQYIQENINKFKNGLGKKGLKKFKRLSFIVILLMMISTTTTVLAADDPLTVINNLSDFIFALIRTIGIIILGFSVVQIGLSIKGHDPSQRANGILGFGGGVIITFSKEIINMITK